MKKYLHDETNFVREKYDLKDSYTQGDKISIDWQLIFKEKISCHFDSIFTILPHNISHNSKPFW